MESTVSVIVTAYNQAPYVGPALSSVFAQTFSDYEVIVVDDGSTDDTAVQLGAFDGRLRYIRQDNQGVAASRNTGINHAKGELLAFLDGDDLWEPGKLSAQVAAAKSYPQSGLIAVNGVQFGKEGVLLDSLIGPEVERLFVGPGSVFSTRCYREFLMRNQIYTTSQSMIPRIVIDAVGQSDTSFRLGSDWDLYLRIASNYDVTFVNTPLICWRYLDTSASGPAHLREFQWGGEMIDILKKQLADGPADCRPLIRRLIRQGIAEMARGAYLYGRRTDRTWASKYLMSLLAHNPTSSAVATSLIALHCPQWLTSRIGTMARRGLRS